MVDVATSSLLGTVSGELVLRFCNGPRVGQTVCISSQKCSIGSAPGCTLRLIGQRIAGVHCVVLRGAGNTVVRAWSHDTLHNGRAFDDAILHAGDRLTAGPVEFEVLALGPLSRTLPHNCDTIPAERLTAPLEPRSAPPDARTIVSEQPEVDPARYQATQQRIQRLQTRLEQAKKQSHQRTRRLIQRIRAQQWHVAELLAQHEQVVSRLENVESDNRLLLVQRDEASRRVEQLSQRERQLVEQVEELTTRCGQQKQHLVEYQQKLAEVESELTRASQQLQQYQQAAESAHDEEQQTIAALREELETRRQDAEQHRLQQEQLECLRQQLAQQRTVLEQQRERLDRQQHELDQQRTQLTQQQLHIKQQREQLDHERQQIKKQQAALDERHGELQRWQQTLDEQRSQLDAAQQAAAEQQQQAEQSIAEREQTLKQRKAELDELADNLEICQDELDQTLNDPQSHLQYQQSVLERQQREIDAASQELQTARQKWEVEREQWQTQQRQQQDELERCRQTIEQRERALADRQREVDDQAQNLQDERRNWEMQRDQQLAEIEQRLAEVHRRQAELERQVEQFAAEQADWERRKLEQEKTISHSADQQCMPTASLEDEDACSDKPASIQAVDAPELLLVDDNEGGEETHNQPLHVEPAPDTPPVSASEVLARLGARLPSDVDGDQDASADDTEISFPTAQQPANTHTAEAEDEDDEASIEQYMAQLLARVSGANETAASNGGTTQPTEQLQAPTLPTAPGASPSTANLSATGEASQPEIPADAEQSARPPRRRRPAPEAASGLSVMRELSHLSAKTALDAHWLSQQRRKFYGRLMVMASGLTAGSVLWAISEPGTAGRYGAGSCLIVGAGWGIQASLMISRDRYRSLFKKLTTPKGSRNAETEASQSTATGSANPEHKTG